MKLFIVESPAKAKTISKYLDGKYKVTASIGHIRDLPKSNKNAVDIENGFTPNYEVAKGKEKVVAELKKLSSQAQEVILATDPDREGEAIAWHIKEACKLKNPKRVVYQEITKEAINRALAKPRPIDDNLRQAQEARRVLDRLFGYDLSGLIWQKLRYGLSAGRVQSPALKILVDREKEIKKFIPEKFWLIEADLKTKAGEIIRFTATDTPDSQTKAEAIIKIGEQAKWRVLEVKQTATKREPRPPFITSTLQQTASSRLGLSPSQTMRLAQKLYEAGHITYMRTDSTSLSAGALAEIEKTIKAEYGADKYCRRQFKSKSKNAQEAHEAIRPTKLAVTQAGRTTEERRLYQLIRQRTLACQMIEAKILRTKIIAGDKGLPPFEVVGSVIKENGWLVADPEARGEDKELPEVKQDDALTLILIESIGKETQPPKRFTEAGLIKELEKRGIGRPSTYAPIIKTLHDRLYVEKENRSLRPTDTGEVVSDFLSEHFSDYISDSFTAHMEDELDEIANGQRTYIKTLTDFYKPFKKAIADKKSLPKITNLGEAPKDIVCPKCGGPMIYKLAKNGKFLSCAKFPDCDGARTLDGKELEGPKDTGQICPECGQANLVEREGRFGKFIACGRYPKCRFVKKDENNKNGDTGITCPVCNQGTMVEKRGRYGLFWACSRYPDCRHAIKSKPTGKICGYPRENGPCPHLLMAGTKTIPERCSDKTCPNHRPDKLNK